MTINFCDNSNGCLEGNDGEYFDVSDFSFEDDLRDAMIFKLEEYLGINLDKKIETIANQKNDFDNNNIKKHEDLEI